MTLSCDISNIFSLFLQNVIFTKFHLLILVLARDSMMFCRTVAWKIIWLINISIPLVDQSPGDHTIIVSVVGRCIHGNQTCNDTSEQNVANNLICSAHTAHSLQIARQVYKSIFLGVIRTCLTYRWWVVCLFSVLLFCIRVHGHIINVFITDLETHFHTGMPFFFSIFGEMAFERCWCRKWQWVRNLCMTVQFASNAFFLSSL